MCLMAGSCSAILCSIFNNGSSVFSSSLLPLLALTLGVNCHCGMMHSEALGLSHLIQWGVFCGQVTTVMHKNREKLGIGDPQKSHMLTVYAVKISYHKNFCMHYMVHSLHNSTLVVSEAVQLVPVPLLSHWMI